SPPPSASSCAMPTSLTSAISMRPNCPTSKRSPLRQSAAGEPKAPAQSTGMRPGSPTRYAGSGNGEKGDAKSLRPRKWDGGEGPRPSYHHAKLPQWAGPPFKPDVSDPSDHG